MDYLFSGKAGTLTYPRDPVYADNAADLVELRIKPLRDATALRVTLNSMKDPERAAFTVAIGSSEAPVAWPHGAGVRSPAELFLTVHGTTAELLDASGAARSPAPTASVDLTRRQIDVRIPHAAWNPGTGTVRLAAATGLWANGGYLRPGLLSSASAPGGMSASGSGLFNVAFRYDEPMPDVSMFGLGVTIADAAAGGILQARWWRERAQADALASGDISKYFHEVDFAKLAAKAGDDSRVPKSGPLSRIFASRQVHGQGVDNSRLCGGIEAAGDEPVRCTGALVGQLQPYAIYVPRKPKPARGYGMTLLLHSLGGNYNQYLDSRNQSQLGERGAGSIVVTPTGRGPDGFYHDVAEGDSFEVWADVARHYDLDPDWAAVSGYSMGGEGTWQYLSRWPDLFARGHVDGRPARPRRRPDGVAAQHAGDGVGGACRRAREHPRDRGDDRTAQRSRPALRGLAVPRRRPSLAGDQRRVWPRCRVPRRAPRRPQPAAHHLRRRRGRQLRARARGRRPRLLALRPQGAQRRAQRDDRRALAGLRRRRSAAARASPAQRRSLEGGARGPQAYVKRARSWGPAPETDKADRLVVRATNVARATVDTKRARLSCAPALDVQSDGPLDLRLACPPPPRSCAKSLRLRLPRLRGSTRATVLHGSRVLRRARGRNLRVVRVKRPTRKAFRLRIVVRAGKRSVTVVRRYRACA